MKSLESGRSQDELWLDLLRGSHTLRDASPSGVRACSLLRLAERSRGQPESAEKAFEAGRLFEREGLLSDAVQAYRWSIGADPTLLAAMERLVALVGVGLTKVAAVDILEKAADELTERNTGALYSN